MVEEGIEDVEEEGEGGKMSGGHIGDEEVEGSLIDCRVKERVGTVHPLKGLKRVFF